MNWKTWGFINAPHTLCEDCANACGNCVWSAFGLPVDGWTATPTKLICNHGKTELIDSFHVTECPQFDRDKKKHTPDIRTDRVMILVQHILVSGIRDYANNLILLEKRGAIRGLKYEIECGERWIKAPMTEDMLHLCGLDVNPQLIIDAIKADPHGIIKRLQISNAQENSDDDIPKKKGRHRSVFWDNPKLQIRNAERKNRR